MLNKKQIKKPLLVYIVEVVLVPKAFLYNCKKFVKTLSINESVVISI